MGEPARGCRDAHEAPSNSASIAAPSVGAVTSKVIPAESTA